MKNSHNANQSLETCNIQKVGKNSIEDQIEVDLHENNYIRMEGKCKKKERNNYPKNLN